MTEQMEHVEIVEGTPVKYVGGKLKGRYARVMVRADRCVCKECGAEFWVWPDSDEFICARCMWKSVGGKNND